MTLGGRRVDIRGTAIKRAAEVKRGLLSSADFQRTSPDPYDYQENQEPVKKVSTSSFYGNNSSARNVASKNGALISRTSRKRLSHSVNEKIIPLSPSSAPKLCQLMGIAQTFTPTPTASPPSPKVTANWNESLTTPSSSRTTLNRSSPLTPLRASSTRARVCSSPSRMSPRLSDAASFKPAHLSSSNSPSSTRRDESPRRISSYHSVSSPAPLSPRIVGFSNEGNTCFMNAVLQCVLGVEPFVSRLRYLDLQVVSILESDSWLLATLQLYLDCTRQTGRQACTPALVRLRQLAAPAFPLHEQHDAQEFLLKLLDSIKEEYTAAVKTIEDRTDATGWTETPVDDFVFSVESRRVCSSCGSRSDQTQLHYLISVDLPEADHSALQDTLPPYFAPQQLELLCEGCGSKSASLTAQLRSLPRVLVIHLKRYTAEKRTVTIPKCLLIAKNFLCEDVKVPTRPVRAAKPVDGGVLDSLSIAVLNRLAELEAEAVGSPAPLSDLGYADDDAEEFLKSRCSPPIPIGGHTVPLGSLLDYATEFPTICESDSPDLPLLESQEPFHVGESRSAENLLLGGSTAEEAPSPVDAEVDSEYSIPELNSEFQPDNEVFSLHSSPDSRVKRSAQLTTASPALKRITLSERPQSPAVYHVISDEEFNSDAEFDVNVEADLREALSRGLSQQSSVAPHLSPTRTAFTSGTRNPVVSPFSEGPGSPMICGEEPNLMYSDVACRYRLIGVTNHRGSMTSGHYTAAVLDYDSDNSLWFYCDDSKISTTSYDRGLHNTDTHCYLAFFEFDE